MSTKSVWHLCSNRWNSAITEYALSSARAMALAGWKSVLSPLPGSPCEKRAQTLGLLGASFPFQPGDIFGLKAEARRLKPDLILLYGGAESFLARFLGGIPRVRFRGQDKDMAEALPPLSTRMNVSHCAALLTPSAELAARFQALLPGKPVHAVSLGLDAARFQPSSGTRPERPTLLIVGRLDPIKGHAAFFRLFHQLLRRWSEGPRPFLEVIGEAANLSAANIRASALAEGLEEGKDWQLIDERIANLSERMSRAHLGVVPSLGSEVICRVAEEFLLCGTALFVSGVGSLEECLRQPAFGLSYRGKSEEESLALLKDCLSQVTAESFKARSARAEAARSLFSWSAMGQSLDAALFPLLGRPKITHT